VVEVQPGYLELALAPQSMAGAMGRKDRRVVVEKEAVLFLVVVLVPVVEAAQLMVDVVVNGVPTTVVAVVL